MDEEMDAALAQMHFYASNVGTWITTTDKRDLRDLIKAMDADQLTYSLWLVPLPWDANYKIKQYAPQVEGAKEIAFFEFRNGKKVKRK